MGIKYGEKSIWAIDSKISYEFDSIYVYVNYF